MSYSQNALNMLGEFSEPDRSKLVFAGALARAPLTPLRTKPRPGETRNSEDECSTPTAPEFRIPPPVTCPPAPRKPRRKPVAGHFAGPKKFFAVDVDGVRFETLFLQRVYSERY